MNFLITKSPLNYSNLAMVHMVSAYRQKLKAAKPYLHHNQRVNHRGYCRTQRLSKHDSLGGIQMCM